MDGKKIRRIILNKKSRMSSKFICVICGEPAKSKITQKWGESYLYSCDEEECKRVIKIQLEGALKNQN